MATAASHMVVSRLQPGTTFQCGLFEDATVRTGRLVPCVRNNHLKSSFLGQQSVDVPLKAVYSSRPTASRKKNSGVIESVTGAPGREGEQSGLDNDFSLPIVPPGTLMVPVMKKSFGSTGGGVTLEKSKLDMSTSKTKMAPKIEMGGGGRGNDNKNFNGGGDGGDDGGDDDDYMGGEGDDDGDDDNGILRKGSIIELFDRETVDAVMKEWFRSIKDLPSGMRRAVEMGLISSAQLVRFIAIDARPTIARAISRIVPNDTSRAFIGRMIADPAFAYKLALEQALTIGTASYWEVKQRGARLKDEWDLALVNVLTVAACNAAVVWAVSPSRSYGTTARYDWQNMLQKLPNHVFDKSYPLREFTLPSRVVSFLYKSAELSLVGSLVGAAGGSVSNALVNIRQKGNPQYRPSVPVPSASTSAMAYGAFLGLSGNLRYQLLYGIDRFLQQNMNNVSLAVMTTTGFRYGNNQLGEPSRLTWLGIDKEAVSHSHSQSHAYHRPSQSGANKSRLLPFSLPSFLTGEQAAESSQSRAKRTRRIKRKVSLAK